MQTRRVSKREFCEDASFITPHFSIRLCHHTQLSPSSVSCSITVISSGNMVIFCCIKCQIEPPILQATCLCAPWLTKIQLTPAASEDCNNREMDSWNKASPCICPATVCQEGKNIFLYTANISQHSSSVQKPLADWVVLLSEMKKPLAVALDCEMGYHSRAFLAKAERRLLGNSWDSKHHNWSGHSVAETGIQMRKVHRWNQSQKCALIFHLFSLCTCHIW